MDTAHLETAVRQLEPWHHDIDLGPFSTFDVAESRGPYADRGHPAPRAQAVREHLPDAEPPGTAVDLGCSDGGITLALADAGWEAIGVDQRRGALTRARFGACVRDAAVSFVCDDARSYLDTAPGADVLVVCGLLYHIESELGERNTGAEQAFVGELCRSGATRVIIETNRTPWLADELASHGATVHLDRRGAETRPGVRQLTVAGC